MADKAPLLRADAVAVPVAMAVPVNAMATPVDPNTCTARTVKLPRW